MKIDTLTKEQEEALGLDDGCVVAGAGAGKTRTLVAKVMHDQACGLPAAHQIVVTFTNAAALEMEARLNARGAQRPGHIGTLHSLALRGIIAAWGGLPKVLKDADFDKVLKDTAKRSRINATAPEIRRWLMEPPRAGNGLLLRKAVLAEMRGQRLVHPDVMLVVYLELLRERPETRDVRLYVDEAQDASSLDFAIYSNLSKSGKNRGTAIYFGDPRQAIYAFRGAKPELFEQAIHGHGFICNLTTNWRSGLSIIDEANRIAAMMPFGAGMVMPMTAPPAWETTGLVTRRGRYTATAMEAMQLAGEIRQALDNQESVAVLARYNDTVDTVAAMLRAEGLQVELPGREVEKDPALERLRNLTPDDLPPAGQSWERHLMTLGVPFVHQEYLAKMLMGVRSVLEIGPIIDEALGQPSGEKGKVWVSTIHGSKGLEWDHVHLVGADHLALDVHDPEDVRLGYVAVTRARKVFSVSHALHRNGSKGDVSDLKPSAIFFPPAA